MEYFEDYYLRLIHEMVRMILKLLFNIDSEGAHTKIEEDVEQSEKYNELLELAKSGKINEAENMLYKEGFLKDKNDLLIGLMFYDYVVKQDNEFLEEHNYSKTEVKEGVEMLLKKFGYEDMSIFES